MYFAFRMIFTRTARAVPIVRNSLEMPCMRSLVGGGARGLGDAIMSVTSVLSGKGHAGTTQFTDRYSPHTPPTVHLRWIRPRWLE